MANKIISSLADIVTNAQTIKALAFCVSQKHAEFMASKFNLAGINADVLTSKNTNERAAKQQALRQGEIQILCVVDIFNEGVDIPEVDTLLFLRPTESLTLFLQQLGRGLRLPDNSQKQCCTVLDFVGNARPEYDFASKFRALIGKSNQPIKTEIENNFPHLPLGCRIELQKRTQQTILKNIQQAINSKRRLQQLINSYSQHTNDALTLSNFLRINPQVTLEDVYKPKDKKLGGWLWLKGDEIPAEQADIYAAYYRAINTQLLGCDSISYLCFLRDLCNNDFSFTPTAQNQQYALMAHYNFWDSTGTSLGFKTLEQSLQALKHKELQHELAQVIALLINRIHQQESDLSCLPNHAIKLHSRYTRQQILAALGAHSFDKKSTAREGVLEFKNQNQNLELLFVTLNKCEKTYSPTTLYHDYAISPTLFHWQTQNSARPEHGRGLSYIQHQQTGKTIVLFVREQGKDENGRTMGFVNYGEVKYQSHNDSQPMNITWELTSPMPSEMWHEAGKLAVG